MTEGSFGELKFNGLVTGGRLVLVTLAAMMAITVAGTAMAQDGRIGRVQQGLVGGSVVTPEGLERNGLLTLDTGCSASLLRNNWIITAAHCVDRPNPMAAGQFILNPENSVTLTANWNVVQRQQSMRIISFRPLDVAIIRVAIPFVVDGSSTNYNREMFREGELKSLPIVALGRGINQFAEGSGATASPSRTDGQFRVGLFNIESAADNKYRFESTNGQSIAGGDSGGPSYATVGDRVLLVGVHSGCQFECAPGKTCGTWPGPGPAPAGYTNWRWVTATPSCSDAAVAPVWDDIDRYLGVFTPAAKPVLALGKVKPAPIGLGKVKGTSTNPSAPPVSICDAARSARARNSPAAPGLEAQCRAVYAAKGEAIAKADSVVAAARVAEADANYRSGFDIATAIFGDPALGAQGNTATGPGSLGIRNALNAAGQRGFNASVALHLSRNYKP